MDDLGRRTFVVKRLFLLVVTLKILSSGLSLWLDSPWVLGFVVPLAFMGLYIWLGLTRRDESVTDEKFADSCYYLGFIFTISSIVVCLFDLQAIGTSLQDIAIRFGAAMVSTVLGLVVRVYLVQFRPDVEDSLRTIEDALVESAQMFRARLDAAVVDLGHLRTTLDSATKSAVESINEMLNTTTKSYGDKTAEYFQSLSEESRLALRDSASEIKNLAQRSNAHIAGYAESQARQLGLIQDGLVAQIDAIKQRVDSIQVPPDIFTNQLNAPLQALRSVTQEVAKSVSEVSTELKAASRALRSTLQKVATEALVASDSLAATRELAGKVDALQKVVENQTLHISTVAERIEELYLRENREAEISAPAASLSSPATSSYGDPVLPSISSFEEPNVMQTTADLDPRIEPTTRAIS